MIINHNIPALSTYSQLTKNNKATAGSLKKLSSGQQINTAADDASGLAISEKMRAQIRGLDQASVNAQDGISLIQSAEGNLGETEDILQRIRELADKSANDTKVAGDRDEIQKEINQLTSEINRIGNTTEFNTQKLLNGGGTETNYDTIVNVAGGGAGTISGLTTRTAGVSEVAGQYSITIGTSQAGGDVVVNGQRFTLSANNTATDMAAELLAKIQADTTLSEHYTVTSANNVVTLTEKATTATGTALTATGATVGLTTSTATASIKEKAGEYTFALEKGFEVAGDTISIAGTLISATASDNPGIGEFTISGDKEEQAKSIAKAINSHATLGQTYEAIVDGSVITLRQRAGKGAAAAPASSGANSSSVAGQYTLETNSLVKAGGKFTLDGEDIAVVDDKNDARLSNGKAILATDSLTEQASRLKNAINSNNNLKDRYTADVINGSKVQLTQKAGYHSLKTSTISSKTTSTDGFEAKLQIGANSFQSMTVKINDMRAAALGIVGTKANGAVISPTNGAKAQYTADKNVNNGTTDANVEYALDVSTHEKATAAITIVNDAIEKVSAERSRLGAYQNRLDHAVNNLTVSSQNMTDAESRIRDTDMAKEMMTFQKNQILGQAAQSMLAQANQLPQGVLQLLQ